jgi:hypothetical protein
LPRQFQADLSPATATLRRRQRSAPPSTAKMPITQGGITIPIAPAATKTTRALLV